MITADYLKEKLLPFIKTKEADKAGAVFFRTHLQVSRFSNSLIHQHLSDEDQSIYFRALTNGRLGLASTNSLTRQNLRETFNKAVKISHLRLDAPQKRDIPDFRPLDTVSGFTYAKTINTSARTRAKTLQRIFADADKLKIKFSGNFYNGLAQFAVISPTGRINYQDYSFAGIKLIAAHKSSSGYAAQTGYDIEKLDVGKIARAAIEKCRLGHDKTSLKPGRYDVILEPAAVAELILWLNYIGFGAKSTLEETGFLYNKYSKRITGSNVTIYDNGKDINTFILPFDFEGLPRKKTPLIKQGLASMPLCDSYYAKLLNIKSSGHANFPDDIEGPLGYNLIMRRGDISSQEIKSSAKKALLISSFHYINGFLNTNKALMTGLTRGGTFLIAEGKIKRAISDMRFTEYILKAFSRIKHISRERFLIADNLDGIGSVYVPYLYIKGFNFTS